MELLDQLKSDTFLTINALFYKIGEGLMSFLYAIIILIIGWLVTKMALIIVDKALKISKIDTVSTKINEAKLFGKSEFKIDISKIILLFVKWLIVLIFLIIAADVMQWTIISVEISNLLRYLPKLFSALSLFMIGIYMANFVRKAIYKMFNSFDLSGAKIVSSAFFYGIISLITITALNQAEIDTSIITNNLTIIFGAFLLTFALAFGFGSKDVVQNLLLSFYSRKNYNIGQIIKFKDIEGEILAIDNISLTLKTETKKLIIPIKDIVENTIEVID